MFQINFTGFLMSYLLQGMHTVNMLADVTISIIIATIVMHMYTCVDIETHTRGMSKIEHWYILYR